MMVGNRVTSRLHFRILRSLIPLVTLLIVPALGFAQDGSHFRSALKSFLKETPVEGLDDLTAAQYLSLHAHQKMETKRIMQLANDLSSPEFSKRERAQKSLMLVALLPSTLPEEVGNGSPELRWRWKQILDERKPLEIRLILAALRDIVESPPKAFLPELRLLLINDQYANVRYNVSQAFLKIASKNDFEFLKQCAHDPAMVQLRMISIEALARQFKAKSIPDLRRRLKDDDLDVQFAAARLLVDLKQRDALLKIAEFLSDKKKPRSYLAFQILGSVTGKKFGQLPYAEGEARQKKIKECRDWIRENLESIELRIPIYKHLYAPRSLGGHTLLVLDDERIVEYDDSMKEILTVKSKGISGAEKLPNGNFIVHSFSGNELKVITPQGKLVWNKSTNINGTQLLQNGNLLITTGSNKRVVEIDLKTRKEIWSHEVKSWVNDASRLPSGNTLIAARSRITEVTPDGKIVWEYSLPADKKSYLAAQPLMNGNILIATTGNTGRIYEMTRDKEIIWKMSGLGSIQDALIDEQGHLWIMTEKRVVRFDNDRKKIWKLDKGTAFGEIRR